MPRADPNSQQMFAVVRELVYSSPDDLLHHHLTLVIILHNVTGVADDERRLSSQYTQISHSAAYRQSSSSQDGVEWLSRIFPPSGHDINSVPSLQNSQTHVVSTGAQSNLALLDDVNPPSVSVTAAEPQDANRQENTFLFDATMEMTQCINHELVTVNSEAKNQRHKPKRQKNNQSAMAEKAKPGDGSSESKASERVATDAVSYTLENVSGSQVADLCLSKAKSRGVMTSRIPKPSQAGNLQRQRKRTKPQMESSETVLPVTDDSLMDPETPASKEESEKALAEKSASGITCRRSRTKVQRLSSVARKSAFQSSASESRLVDLEEAVMGKHPETPEEHCADEGIHTSEHSDRPSTGATNKICPTVSSGERLRSGFERTPDPHKYTGTLFVQETQRSCKRPWVATSDSESLQDNPGLDDYEALPLEKLSSAEFQKPKKSRREEVRKSKAAHREEGADRSTERRKNCSRGNSGFGPVDEVPPLQELHGIFTDNVDDGDGQTGSAEVQEDVLSADVSEKDAVFASRSKRTKSKSRSPRGTKHRPKRSSSTEKRNPRETFVVDRRKTYDIGPILGTEKSNASCAYSHIGDEAAQRDLGELLTDEMPPWLVADTEMDSVLTGPRWEKSLMTEVIEQSASTDASPGVITVLVCHTTDVTCNVTSARANA